MARNLIDDLNRSMPVAADLQLGQLLQDLITAHNAVLAKLDALGNVANNSVALLNAAAGTNNVATLTVVDLVTRGRTAS